MRKIKIFKGAAVIVDENSKLEIETNTGDMVDEVPATAQNIDKYIRDKKYPENKPIR